VNYIYLVTTELSLLPGSEDMVVYCGYTPDVTELAKQFRMGGNVFLSGFTSAMKAMKALRAAAMKSGGPMTQSAVIASVAETNDLKNKQVKGVIEALFAVASGEVKKNGNFKLAGMLNLKLKKKPASPAKKGINPFTKEPCVFKAKSASKTVWCLAMKKLKEALN